ncbi:ImmA/IrrE family metallo-endopeptidase [Alicyclobacillus fastidiosus]|uniref:ImmA/IrrE family metallo-endopeptidase n=1 Tax=Alicyclobacillus fastidiosus TaxID=392011 RepID=UPI0034D77F8E
MTIKEKVKMLVAKYGTSSPFEIAEARKILIFKHPLGNILGYYTRHRRVQMIYLNSHVEDRHLQRFVCAHELGHATLHPEVNTPFLRRNTLFSVDKIEREANTFAVELLIPDDAVYRNEGCSTSREISTAYGVPPELIQLKRIH